MTTKSRLTPRAKGTHAPPRRFAWAQIAVAVCFMVLIGRLYMLQVMSGEYYMRKSADNFVKELELPATRGQIRDRKGTGLAEDRPGHRHAFRYARCCREVRCGGHRDNRPRSANAG